MFTKIILAIVACFQVINLFASDEGLRPKKRPGLTVDTSIEDKGNVNYFFQISKVKDFFYHTRRVPGTREPLYRHVSRNPIFDQGRDSSFGGRAFDLFRPCKHEDTCPKCSKYL